MFKNKNCPLFGTLFGYNFFSTPSNFKFVGLIVSIALEQVYLEINVKILTKIHSTNEWSPFFKKRYQFGQFWTTSYLIVFHPLTYENLFSNGTHAC